jgi:hypothetical protein
MEAGHPLSREKGPADPDRLAALTPRPRINLVPHNGVLASHSRWRVRAVAYGRDTLEPVGLDSR